nr:hypothetical protein 9 [Saccharospirillaceae bacterium]
MDERKKSALQDIVDAVSRETQPTGESNTYNNYGSMGDTHIGDNITNVQAGEEKPNSHESTAKAEIKSLELAAAEVGAREKGSYISAFFPVQLPLFLIHALALTAMARGWVPAMQEPFYTVFKGGILLTGGLTLHAISTELRKVEATRRAQYSELLKISRRLKRLKNREKQGD